MAPTESCALTVLGCRSYLLRREAWLLDPRTLLIIGLLQVEEVAHFVFFGLHVGAGDFVDAGAAGDTLHDLNAGALELADFLRVVG